MLGGGTRAAVQSGYGFLLDSLIGGGGMVRAMGSPLFLTGLAQARVSFVIIFLLRILLRRPWLAACVFVVIVDGSLLQPPRYDLRRLLHDRRGTPNAADARVRIPLLRLVGVPCRFLDTSFVTGDFGVWYAQSSWLAVVVIASIALWASCVPGRPPWPAGSG